MGSSELIHGLLAFQIAVPKSLLIEIRFTSELAATGHALVQLDPVTGSVAYSDQRAATWAFFCSYRSVFGPFQMATKIVAIGL